MQAGVSRDALFSAYQSTVISLASADATLAT